jgi:hypothetical protein
MITVVEAAAVTAMDVVFAVVGAQLEAPTIVLDPLTRMLVEEAALEMMAVSPLLTVNASAPEARVHAGLASAFNGLPSSSMPG